MASPMPIPPIGNWGGNGQAMPPQPPVAMNEADDVGVQVKTMGLKVTYTVADSGESFLARHPQLISIQTVPINDKQTIGMVDLKMCAQAVVRCSPELLSDVARDFAVYAYDYSEPDEPLVGQGLLGWIVNNSSDKRIIGRATKNPLSVFSGGVKDILEIRFKLKPVAAMVQPPYEAEIKPDLRHTYQRSESHMSVEIQPTRPAEGAITPSSHAEWNSLRQSHPQMGMQQQHPSRIVSPHPPPNQIDFPQPHQRSNSFSYNAPPPQQPPPPQMLPQPPQQPMQNSEGPNRVAPTPVDTATEPQANPPSRPSSRASNRSKRSKPTGRPRGRPRKQPPAESQGNTSGYEDGTDGDEGPAKKKRATTTQVTNNINTPFGGGPELLRVAASTSGSLRTLRPAGLAPDMPMGSHIQEVPRAPTPVPDKGPAKPKAGKTAKGSKLRRQSTLSQAATPPSQPPFSDVAFAMSPSQQDGRSPVDSEAVSPMYSQDSPAPIGSSPPVPRTTSFVRSSPPASSPILPPMPMPMGQLADSGFMSGSMDDLFDEDGMKHLPQPISAQPSMRSNITKEKRSRDGFPIQVFQLAAQPSSEADPARSNTAAFRAPTCTPLQEPALPSLARSVSDSRVMMAPPHPQLAEKEPSPQQEEPVVAIKADVENDVSEAPKVDSPLPVDGLDTGLEQLAQAVKNMHELALPEPSRPARADTSFVRPSAPPSLQRSASSGFSLALPTVLASDPVGPLALPVPPQPDVASFSETPCPPSDALQPPKSPEQPTRTNKNLVKKQAIREKLLQAIENGETPMYCTNCGAIETPTWRKIWTQEHKGAPEFTEFSDKPGRITAILVLDRDADDKPTRYQIIKKALAPRENKDNYTGHMLCNPCGIWLSKWKCHRPAEKWEKDKTRLNQQRRPRGTGRGPRPPRTKKTGANQMNPTSEAYFTTDPIGPEDRGISPMDDESRSRGVSQVSNANDASEQSFQQPEQLVSRSASPGDISNPGSTHSRGSGTVKSPITIDNADSQADMGSTRRLLFPSPRKEGVPKILGELAVNIVQTSPESNESTASANTKAEKEPSKDGAMKALDTNKENLLIPDDDLESLFRSPAVARPSTPPPRDRALNNALFKTPTRSTPSHRPITRSVTRSVSRSLRSNDLLRSPAASRRTPSRTPRSAKGPIRRSPRLHQDDFSQMEIALEEYLQTQPMDHEYDSDMLEAMNRALADTMNASGTNFDIGNMQFEFGDLLGSPARPSPRTRQVGDHDDWQTWESSLRARQSAEDAGRR